MKRKELNIYSDLTVESMFQCNQIYSNQVGFVLGITI